jgi:hypothetical protein
MASRTAERAGRMARKPLGALIDRGASNTLGDRPAGMPSRFEVGVKVTSDPGQRHRSVALLAVAAGLVAFLSFALAACTVGRTTLPTVVDTGVSTTSTAPASVPAVGSSITADQIKDLLARTAGYTPGEWRVSDHRTFGDWAAARAYVDQDGQAGYMAVFTKSNGAWFCQDHTSLTDPNGGAISLAGMEAPKEVWAYFDLEPGVVAGALHEPVLPPDMPSGFGFVAEWGVARMNSLDTFEGTFTKDLVTGSPPTATTRLMLTSDEKQALYRALRALEPWSYPSRFEPPYASAPAGNQVQVVTPATKYHLSVVGDGIEKDIWWTDDNLSGSAGAVALRAWFRQVMGLVESKPEYKAMPEARGGYAQERGWFPQTGGGYA